MSERLDRIANNLEGLVDEVGEWKSAGKVTPEAIRYLELEISRQADALRVMAAQEHERWLDSVWAEVRAESKAS